MLTNFCLFTNDVEMTSIWQNQLREITGKKVLNEGMPLVILEAMAASKPVVATKVGGIPEIIIDGKTGYLVPPYDVHRLAGAIIQLSNDRKKKRCG